MNAHPLKQQAEQFVTRLLERRLRQANLGLPGETNFQVEAEEVRPFAGGVEVRVRTWRHWSDATVCFDADNLEVMERSIDRYALPACSEQMAAGDAQAAVRAAIPVPSDAELEQVDQVEYAAGCTLARVRWRHMHQGLPVLGDFLVALVHPKTRRLVEVRCKWRQVKL